MNSLNCWLLVCTINLAKHSVNAILEGLSEGAVCGCSTLRHLFLGQSCSWMTQPTWFLLHRLWWSLNMHHSSCTAPVTRHVLVLNRDVHVTKPVLYLSVFELSLLPQSFLSLCWVGMSMLRNQSCSCLSLSCLSYSKFFSFVLSRDVHVIINVLMLSRNVHVTIHVHMLSRDIFPFVLPNQSWIFVE